LGKEGGTWLGLSRTGKISGILNLRDDYDSTKLGRGFLVPSYLNSDKTTEHFVNDHLKSESKRNIYNPFNMLFYQQNKQNGNLWEMSIFNSYLNTFEKVNSGLNELYFSF
jgi:uncharacterized protein with NRDE domain